MQQNYAPIFLGKQQLFKVCPHRRKQKGNQLKGHQTLSEATEKVQLYKF